MSDFQLYLGYLGVMLWDSLLFNLFCRQSPCLGGCSVTHQAPLIPSQQEQGTTPHCYALPHCPWVGVKVSLPSRFCWAELSMAVKNVHLLLQNARVHRNASVGASLCHSAEGRLGLSVFPASCTEYGTGSPGEMLYVDSPAGLGCKWGEQEEIWLKDSAGSRLEGLAGHCAECGHYSRTPGATVGSLAREWPLHLTFRNSESLAVMWGLVCGGMHTHPLPGGAKGHQGWPHSVPALSEIFTEDSFSLISCGTWTWAYLVVPQFSHQ